MRRAASTCEVRPMNLRRVLPSWAARRGDGSCWERREDAEGGTGGTVIAIDGNVAGCDVRGGGRCRGQGGKLMSAGRLMG